MAPRVPTMEPEDFGELILGGESELDADAVARESGVPEEQARRLWRALGFPDAGDQAAFSAGDVEALRRVSQAIEDTDLDLDTIVRMTRGVGQTLARLAEWEVGTLASTVTELPTPEGRRAAGERLLRRLGPHFEALLVYAWRRHLAAAVARAEVLVPEQELEVAQATVGFADLVGFSARTNDLSQEEIGDLVEVFESRCSDVIAQHGGRVVKTLGDSVLFVANDPDSGVDIGWGVIALIGPDQHLPDVRVGLVCGPVVQRMGDVYGPAVNLASRLTGVARRNRLITDQHTAEVLSDDEFEIRVLSARPVRGFGELEPVAVRRRRTVPPPSADAG